MVVRMHALKKETNKKRKVPLRCFSTSSNNTITTKTIAELQSLNKFIVKHNQLRPDLRFSP
jgi:hypothetical protein